MAETKAESTATFDAKLTEYITRIIQLEITLKNERVAHAGKIEDWEAAAAYSKKHNRELLHLLRKHKETERQNRMLEKRCSQALEGASKAIQRANGYKDMLHEYKAKTKQFQRKVREYKRRVLRAERELLLKISQKATQTQKPEGEGHIKYVDGESGVWEQGEM